MKKVIKHIRLASDLHLECITNNPHLKPGNKLPAMDEDKDTLLVLAGDIVCFGIAGASGKIAKGIRERAVKFIKNCCDQFAHVIYIPGNHEWWDTRLGEDIGFIFLTDRDNLSFSEKGVLELDDFIFIYTSLFTDINRRNPIDMVYVMKESNDLSDILDRDGSRMLPDKWVNNHDVYKKHILDTLRLNQESKKPKRPFVITHHAPSSKSISSLFTGDRLNCMFKSDLDNFIEDNYIELWIHGHMHHNVDYYIGSTRVLCNPSGYCGSNSNFDPNLKIDL
jgi:UDP-2,3-diacylglucosamine pyrophosphatase LpxH